MCSTLFLGRLEAFSNRSKTLLKTLPLPMITLANRTQTMAKGIGSARPHPSLPLAFVFYVLDSLFNLIYISKLIHDLDCSITLFHYSVTLQDQSTGRTIGIEHESLQWMHLLSTVISVIPIFPTFRRWFPAFPTYLH